LEIKVLGTKFYVYARDSSGTAQVYLEEGSLQLISEASGQKIMMCPNELACLDRSTGQITFSKESDINSNITVVRNGGLIFDNQPLSKVVEQLEINYNYKFIIDSSISDYPFTGILPTGDILETIKILELSFNLHSSIQDKEIRLGRR
jgi:ferric-dicitrate binding protein FerR (iron transport regulator)